MRRKPDTQGAGAPNRVEIRDSCLPDRCSESGSSHISRGGERLYSQPCLVHQGQDRFAEEFEIWRKVEERDLYSVAAGSLEPDQLVNDEFGTADDLDVAAEGAVLVAMDPQPAAKPSRSGAAHMRAPS